MSTVNHPAHYHAASPEAIAILSIFVSQDALHTECIEAIEAYGFGFHVGNAIKYLWRSGKKGDAIEDYQKALWYLKRYQAISPEQTSETQQVAIAIPMLEALIPGGHC